LISYSNCDVIPVSFQSASLQSESLKFVRFSIIVAWLTDYRFSVSCLSGFLVQPFFEYPAELCDDVCFAPLRHSWNSPSRFSFFTALFSWV